MSTSSRWLRRWMQHHFNALHVYAALSRMGVSKGNALHWSLRWERVMHRALYGR